VPFCNFFRHASCPTHLQHIVLLAFVVVNDYKVKAKKQRAAPALNAKRHARKNYPKLY
jgi:hypothetical protein